MLGRSSTSGTHQLPKTRGECALCHTLQAITSRKNCFRWHLGGLQGSTQVAQPTSSTPRQPLAPSSTPRTVAAGSSSHSTISISQSLNLGVKHIVHIRDSRARNTCILPWGPQCCRGSGLPLTAKLMFCCCFLSTAASPNNSGPKATIALTHPKANQEQLEMTCPEKLPFDSQMGKEDLFHFRETHHSLEQHPNR